MSLQNLPRDMLIKLISTIQAEKDEQIKKLQREVDLLTEVEDLVSLFDIYVDRCPVDGCNAMIAREIDGDSHLEFTDQMNYCDKCKQDYCTKHSTVVHDACTDKERCQRYGIEKQKQNHQAHQKIIETRKRLGEEVPQWIKEMN